MISRFGSVSELFDLMRQAPRCRHQPNSTYLREWLEWTSVMEQAEQAFDGSFHDLEGNWWGREAMLRALRHPETSLLALRVEKLAKHAFELLQTPAPQRRIERELDAGHELDPLGWLLRRPDSWSQVTTKPKPLRVLRILVNITLHSKETTESLLWRGAAPAALAMALARRGERVEVVVGFHADRVWDGGAATLLVTVKPATAPLSPEVLALACSNGAFVRHALSVLLQVLPGDADPHFYHFGKHGAEGVAPFPPEVEAEASIVMGRDISTEEEALAWLRAHGAEGRAA